MGRHSPALRHRRCARAGFEERSGNRKPAPHRSCSHASSSSRRLSARRHGRQRVGDAFSPGIPRGASDQGGRGLRHVRRRSPKRLYRRRVCQSRGTSTSSRLSRVAQESNLMFELIRADLDRKMRGFGVRPEDQTFFRKRITPLLELGTLRCSVSIWPWVYSLKIPVLRQLIIAIYLVINTIGLMLTGIHIQRESNIGPGLLSTIAVASLF